MHNSSRRHHRMMRSLPDSFAAVALGADLGVAVLAPADRNRPVAVADRGHADLIRLRLGSATARITKP